MRRPRLRHGRSRRGAALVEFALVCGLLLLLLFGIIEAGLIFKDQATLAQAAREAARSAAVGSTTATAKTRAVNSAIGVALTPASVTLERSGDGGATWSPLGDSGAANAAVTGDLVRATVTYPHPLVTSFLFAGGSKTLTSRVAMRRE